VFLGLGDCELHVPDVPDLVQKMLEDLYNAVIHHQVEACSNKIGSLRLCSFVNRKNFYLG
jgi:hypothetical protein